VGKQWTAHLVADYFHHDEIKEAVKIHELLPPQQKIGKWAAALTEKWESLTEDQKATYALLAKEWKEKGPPPEVQRRLVFGAEMPEFILLMSNQ